MTWQRLMSKARLKPKVLLYQLGNPPNSPSKIRQVLATIGTRTCFQVMESLKLRSLSLVVCYPASCQWWALVRRLRSQWPDRPQAMAHSDRNSSAPKRQSQLSHYISELKLKTPSKAYCHLNQRQALFSPQSKWLNLWLCQSQRLRLCRSSQLLWWVMGLP